MCSRFTPDAVSGARDIAEELIRLAVCEAKSPLLFTLLFIF